VCVLSHFTAFLLAAMAPGVVAALPLTVLAPALAPVVLTVALIISASLTIFVGVPLFLIAHELKSVNALSSTVGGMITDSIPAIVLGGATWIWFPAFGALAGFVFWLTLRSLQHLRDDVPRPSS
jgi:hypothetical protein